MTELEVCSMIIIRHKKKENLCRFFVVPRGSHVLLGMSDIQDTRHSKCEVQHNIAQEACRRIMSKTQETSSVNQF